MLRTSLRTRVAFSAVALSITGTFLACSFISDADAQQCNIDADCRTRGKAFEKLVCVETRCVNQIIDAGPEAEAETEADLDPWRCVGKKVPDPGTSQVTAHDRFYNLLDNTTNFAGLELDLCSNTDVKCVSPIQHAVTGADGYADFKFAANAFVYINAPTPPPGAPDLLPSIFYQPYAPSQFGGVPRGMMELNALKSLAGIRGQEIDPAKGYVLAVGIDCDMNSPSGVLIDIEAGKTVFGTTYIQGAVPTASETGTIDFGIGIILDVTPGQVGITSRLYSDKRVTQTKQIQVKAGVATTVLLSPILPY